MLNNLLTHGGGSNTAVVWTWVTPIDHSFANLCKVCWRPPRAEDFCDASG